MDWSKIIRIEKVTYIDRMDVLGYDLTPGGISSRGLVRESHVERTLIIFNKFKWKLWERRKR